MKLLKRIFELEITSKEDYKHTIRGGVKLQRIKCTIQYDGTNFSGFQIQSNKRTVQFELENTLKRIHKQEEIRITASGRTDKGVHAIGQVIHFDTPIQMTEQAWNKALNALLPDDIYVRSVEKVPNDFHARFSVSKKEYRYRILNRTKPDIFKRHYVCYVKTPLDLSRMKEACKYLIGTHDFTSFSSAKATVKGDKIRTIYEMDIIQEKEEIMLKVVGSGFLYNMVRIIAGTLIEIGSKERDPNEIPAILEAKDRGAAGKTAPPQGLYLWRVEYNNKKDEQF
jgi:tRNA pseudouridine38-40 synthase